MIKKIVNLLPLLVFAASAGVLARALVYVVAPEVAFAAPGRGTPNEVGWSVFFLVTSYRLLK